MALTFAELIEVNRQVVAAFDAGERRRWGLEVTMIELTKQVGDLARSVLITEGYYLTDRDSDPRRRRQVLAPGGVCVSVDDGRPKLLTADLTLLRQLAESGRSGRLSTAAIGWTRSSMRTATSTPGTRGEMW